MKTLNFNGAITSITAKGDGSLGLRMVTPELKSLEKVAVMELQNQNLIVNLTPMDEKPVGEVNVDADLNSKSQSQRIRAILFVLWKQDGQKGEFSDFYKKKTEAYIDLLKGQINE